MEPPEIEPAIEDPMQEAGVPKNPPPRQDHCRRQEAAADAARQCRRQEAVADASDDEEEEEDEEEKIPRAEVPGGGPWSRCQSVPCRSKRRSSTSPLTGHSQGGAGRGVPAAPPRVLAGIAAFAPDVFPPTHGRHRVWPTEEEEEEVEEDDDEEEEEEAGGGS